MNIRPVASNGFTLELRNGDEFNIHVTTDNEIYLDVNHRDKRTLKIEVMGENGQDWESLITNVYMVRISMEEVIR